MRFGSQRLSRLRGERQALPIYRLYTKIGLKVRTKVRRKITRRQGRPLLSHSTEARAGRWTLSAAPR